MPTYDRYDLCLHIIYMLSVLFCVCNITFIRLLYKIMLADTSTSLRRLMRQYCTM